MSQTKRVALVTGASSGIGRAEAVALAKAGYDVAINYSRSSAEAQKTAEQCEKAGAKTLLAQCDVGDEPAVIAMIEAVRKAFGRLDVLCNNAGTTIKTLAREFEQVTAEEWDRVFSVNVKGVFLVTKHAVPLLRASDDACIVITNSFVGARPGPQPLPYSASKGAVWTMTKALAGALGPVKIRVNGVAPGWMEGEWMQRMLGDNYEKMIQSRAKRTPLQRVINAADVAETALSLIESNKAVNGVIVVVDCGYGAVT